MSSVLLAGQSQVATAAALGQTVDDASGESTKQLLATLNSENKYQWISPKSGILSSVFPSSSTWHPLYNHDYLKIADNLFNSDNNPNISTSVKETVIDSYRVAAMGVFWKIVVVLIIVLIIVLYSGRKLSDMSPALMGLGAAATAVLLYANFIATGNGDAYWADFNSDLTGKLRSNMTPAAILDAYSKKEQRDQNAAVLAAQYSHNYGSGIDRGLEYNALDILL